MHFNVNKLKGKIIESGLSVAELAKKIGISESAMYRKMSDGGRTMLIKDANAIVSALKLSSDDAMAIFFSENIA